MIEHILEGIIVAAVLGIAGAISKKVRDKKSRSNFVHKSRLLVDSFFHSTEFINSVLINERDAPTVSNEFVDYSIVRKNGYYRGDSRRFRLRINGQTEEVEVPYKELVSFVHTAPVIKLDTSGFDNRFELSPALVKKTTDAFNRFKSTRMLTTNDTTVRVCGFHKSSEADNEYICKVQRATYYDQVHTNLTLDRLFAGVEEDSVRSLDLGPDKSLPAFEDSIMANTLGVSAIWVMADHTASSRNAKLRYFLMPRSRKTGIYNGMYSSVGGVARIPEGATFKDNLLETYARDEMKREFLEESGVDFLLKTRKLKETDIRIVPLAFVRDLIRGGKPQFFFLISTPTISSKDLLAAFRNSFNGTEEFNCATLEKMRKMYLSPETYCNFLYALEWIQRKKKTDFIDLD